MRLTRAAPAAATSSRTPPITRAFAPLIGASSASVAARLFERGAGFRTAFGAVRTAFLLRAFFAGFDFLWVVDFLAICAPL